MKTDTERDDRLREARARAAEKLLRLADFWWLNPSTTEQLDQGADAAHARVLRLEEE